MLTAVVPTLKPTPTKKQFQAVMVTPKTVTKTTLTHKIQQEMKGSTVTMISKSRQSKPQVIEN
jgi:hypothetical protein